ncbi:tyrosine-type recombinase/integrase [bacterium]|nr:tyrosine-type recombinase/integrase [bacterium]
MAVVLGLLVSLLVYLYIQYDKRDATLHNGNNVASIRLTQQLVRELPGPSEMAKGSSSIFCDQKVPGLRLEVTRRGTRAFYFIFAFRGRKHCLRLGSADELSLDEARALAMEMRAQLHRGEFPVTEVAKNRATRTVGDVARLYIRETKGRLRSWRNLRQILRANVLPEVGNLLVTQLTPRMAQRLHDDLVKQGRNDAARKAVSALSGLLTFAQREGWIATNPARLVRKVRPAEPRGRYLTEEEIARFYEALDQESNVFIKGLMAFLLATGLRRGEAMRIKWTDINAADRIAHLRITKNGKSRRVPLNKAAWAVVASLPRIDRNPHLFVGRIAGSPIADPTPAFRRVCKRAGLTGVRIHDLRRTFGTVALNASVPLESVSELLGHSSLQITRSVYAKTLPSGLRNATEAVGAALMRPSPAKASEPAETSETP